MKSTLPILEAERLSSGAVRLSQNGKVVMRYDSWRPDLPTRSCRLVYLNKTYYQLTWKPKP